MLGRPLILPDIVPFVQNVLRHVRPADKTVINIGACVSGGPDSMALASLLRQLEQQELDGRRICLTGLIVDHRARRESTDEAIQVQRNLAQIGINSTILTMAWMQGVDPLQLTDFESQARMKRYQLLVREALNRQIDHLFLGHHQDDQVETIIMRLIRNQTFSLRGLIGMAPSARIPVREQEYGGLVGRRDLPVPASGPYPKVLSKDQRHIRHTWQQNIFRIAANTGILLHRPLLPFSKADLVATCKAGGVPYVIDPTNKDPQTSFRNAVRHMRTTFKLPAALGRHRMLQLQQKALNYLKRTELAGSTVLSQCQIVSLDVRSGVLKVRIPSQPLQSPADIEACAYAIEKLLEIVQPTPRTTQSVQLPLDILSRFFGQSSGSFKPFSQSKVYIAPDRAKSRTWTLSRQPMNNTEVKMNTLNFNAPDTCFQRTDDIQECQSSFLLWDNRFWIRISANRPHILQSIVSRPLEETDLSIISRQSKAVPAGSSLDKLSQVLKEAAPGKIRFTLPVLTYENRVVAFPTLNVRLDDVCNELGLNSFSWEVKYNSFGLLETWTKSKATSQTKSVRRP